MAAVAGNLAAAEKKPHKFAARRNGTNLIRGRMLISSCTGIAAATA